MPATVADPNRSLDSEQISPATIAHHTVYEKTPNLHQSHICQWGAQPYLVGPLSRLVGKPPLSPWVSADFLPLTQVVNNTNSAIPLTEIFDRVFSDVCNSLGFEVQKQKKRGSGNNRVYRNLKPCEPLSAFRFFFFGASAWHRKPPQVYSSVVYTPPARHAKTSSHSHPQKQSLGLRQNKDLACIPPARSWLLLRVMASRAREGCQPVRQTVLFLILLQQEMGPLGTFLVARGKHRPHHSIHLYTPRPDYVSQRPLIIHTTHKNKALASDTTKPYLACIPPAINRS